MIEFNDKEYYSTAQRTDSHNTTFLDCKREDKKGVLIASLSNPPITQDTTYFIYGDKLYVLGNSRWGEVLFSHTDNKFYEMPDIGTDWLNTKMIDVKIHDECIEILEHNRDDRCSYVDHGFDSSLFGNTSTDHTFTLIRVNGQDTILFNAKSPEISFRVNENGEMIPEGFCSTLHVWNRLFHGKTVMDNSFDIV